MESFEIIKAPGIMGRLLTRVGTGVSWKDREADMATGMQRTLEHLNRSPNTRPELKPGALGTWCIGSGYQVGYELMSELQEYQVSASGQMSLPAAARHRWHLDRGGPVDVLDLGFGVLTVPRGEGRRLLSDVLSREDHAAFVKSLADDPDLATT